MSQAGEDLVLRLNVLWIFKIAFDQLGEGAVMIKELGIPHAFPAPVDQPVDLEFGYGGNLIFHLLAKIPFKISIGYLTAGGNPYRQKKEGDNVNQQFALCLVVIVLHWQISIHRERTVYLEKTFATPCDLSWRGPLRTLVPQVVIAPAVSMISECVQQLAHLIDGSV